ncbi:MAG: response regulator transcription factor, partial [Thermoleophilia bacterium]|nr:response regulator transcription factor [Thermoleophilia bacterium]
MIVSENFVLRAGFRTWLDNDPEISVVAEVGIGTRAIAELEKWQPDVVVVDHNPPHIDTVVFLEQVRAARLSARIVVVSDVTEYHSVHRVMDAGAAGYLGKSVPLTMLITAIKAVAT